MWMSIMILCGSVYAQSCMVITGNELYPNKEACFKSAIEKANKAIEFPTVYQAKPFCQVIPGTQKSEEEKDT
tara:strand:- start:956 stop:1171 length:216 start_codon:yes stop_codon:yes gene_type:complete